MQIVSQLLSLLMLNSHVACKRRWLSLGVHEDDAMVLVSVFTPELSSRTFVKSSYPECLSAAIFIDGQFACSLQTNMTQSWGKRRRCIVAWLSVSRMFVRSSHAECILVAISAGAQLARSLQTKMSWSWCKRRRCKGARFCIYSSSNPTQLSRVLIQNVSHMLPLLKLNSYVVCTRR